ncbi:MAG: hypothetical protein ACFFDF_21200 [Candidatus Odinarchaeota archaeon]
MKCEYCEKKEASINLMDYPVVFFDDQFRSCNHICDSCFIKLKKQRSLKCKKGPTAFYGRE